MHPALEPVMKKAVSGVALSRREAEGVVPFLRDELPDLMALARLSASVSGVRPFTCGIINAKSGACSEDCAFCAQSSRHGGDAPAIPLASEDDLLRRAERYAADGLDHMSMVTAGRGPTPAVLERACSAARRIRERVGIRLCASLGILADGQAEALRDAGFERYHHNLETSRARFPGACTTHSFDDRVATVARAKAAGLRVCSGGLFGYGESWADRLDFSMDVAAAGPDAIPVNFLIPVPGTPLENVEALRPWEGLGILVLLRLMHPGRNIIMCAGRKTSLAEFGNWACLAGANAVMMGDYLTRIGNDIAEDKRLLDMLGLPGHGRMARK